MAQYQGLSTTQLENLKKEVEKFNAKMIVAKNTLLRVVLNDLKIGIPEGILQGPTAVILTADEGLNALKSLVGFAKTSNDLPKIKLSLIEGQTYDSAQSVTLAGLPSKEVLIGKLLGLLNSPLTRLLDSLKSDQRKLVFVLSEIGKRK